MRLLVYPHDLQIGGSQINAIDLAAAMAEAGHEVMVYGIAGPLVQYIEERGLRFIPANRLKYRPAPTRIAQLAAIARRERLDLIHAYEWPPCLDAYYGAGIFVGVPVLCTVLGMTVMPYVPASVPLIMGTCDLGDQAQKLQRAGVWVLEPPIDTARDHPGIDGSGFRREFEVGDQQLVVTISRLALDLKLDALIRAIDAADVLAAAHPVRLVIVGGGEAHSALLDRSKLVNRRWGREVITLAGQMLDPRPAYAAADVVVGMGSSALRGLSIGRPVVVQGESGFSEIFEASTYDLFLRQGFHGHGDGSTGAHRLANQIRSLLVDPVRRSELGRFGREVVVERFSLERAKRIQLDIYKHVLRTPTRRHLPDALRSMGKALMLEAINHDPRQKRSRRTRERELLEAASEGAWPPRTGQQVS